MRVLDPLTVQAQPDLLTVVPHPRNAKIEHAARPDSPVGRTVTRLAQDPQANHPLRQLERRLGRALLDLTSITDHELNELAGLVLAEKIRRDARWYS